MSAILSKEALNIDGISQLLSEDKLKVQVALGLISCVVDIPKEGPVRLYHATFREFLIPWIMKNENRVCYSYTMLKASSDRIVCACSIATSAGTLTLHPTPQT